MTKTLVSVIMPVYKEPLPILQQAIDSILKQHYRHLELIIVLDNPQNKAAEQTLKSYTKKDKRVTFLKNSRNLGRGASRNKAVRKARGDYIAILDADDVAHPKRISTQVTYFQRHPETQLLFSWATLINQDDKVIGELKPKANHAKKLRKYLFTENILIHPTMMVKTPILQERLYDESFLRSQDYEFWLRCLKENLVFAIIEQALVKYRLPDRSNKDERIRRQGQYSKYSVKALSKHIKWFINPYCLFALTRHLFYRLTVILIPTSIIKLFLEEQQ